MRYKNIMILTIILACLLAISAVSAVENVTDDVVGMDNEIDEVSAADNFKVDSVSVDATNEVSAVSEEDNATDDIAGGDVSEGIVSVNNYVDDIDRVADSVGDEVNSLNTICASSYDDNLSVSGGEEVLSTGTYLKKGPYGYIDSDDMTITYRNPIGYKVRLVGNSISGQSITFIVYKGDTGKHIGDFHAVTNSDGFAYLNADLKPDKYWIQIITDYHGSVYNNLVVKINGYRNAKIDISEPYYGHSGGDINFHWNGNLKGYFNLYKGNKLIYKKYIANNGVGVLTHNGFSEYVYLTKKLSIGFYTVKITNTNGKVIKKASFSISKMPTYVRCDSVKVKSGTTKYISARAYAKSGGNLASGIVQFKINGKTYNAKIKYGEAKIKIKPSSEAKTYTCKVTFIGNKIYKSSYKIFKVTVIGPKKKTTKKYTTKTKITSKKKSIYKKFILKLTKPEKYSSKTIKGNHIHAFYKYRNKGQYGRGVFIDSYGRSGPGTLNGIKLIMAKVYFKNNYGKTKVITKKFDKYGYAQCNLISGYTPYCVVVFYK